MLERGLVLVFDLEILDRTALLLYVLELDFVIVVVVLVVVVVVLAIEP